ncbi:rRNA methyltransferase [Aeromicrobium sp. Root495]|uniref:TrmH family RNA methyltransferase n=1 Tax=Aeromicrobium sp. Root495 TaxID=1736550 RepID=UPI0006FF455C|nr:RNA methyltransferase [Aeromicrobium sp. Root495]KQY59336.1 rRNA methyltransferase [Aeromicrobium sp. Root495]
MAEIVRLVDLDDPRLRDFLHLRDVQLRTRLEGDRGIYIAEGEKVVRRALEAGHEPSSFLMAPRWLETLDDVLSATEAPCFVLEEKDIEHVTGFHVHRGALAAMRRPEPVGTEALLARARRVVVLEDLMDHTNVGAAFRAAAALGFDAVLLSPRCADPFYRRAIKVAMGAVFSLPHARLDDWFTAPQLLREAEFTTYALTLAEDAVPLDEVPTDVERLAVVFGSEGHGLTPHWQRESDVRVIIPMADEIDSLNVASSVAVTCWHLRPRG